ncbi:MAG: hypothetical protein V1897_03150, partial [Pseudomonadota bacterium]
RTRENYKIAHRYAKSLAWASYVDKDVAPLWRGIRLPKHLFQKLQVGHEFDMHDIESWSRHEGVATGFSDSSSSENKPYKIVFRLANPLRGTNIEKLSPLGGEGEILSGGHVMVTKIEEPREGQRYPVIHVDQIPVGRENRGHTVELPEFSETKTTKKALGTSRFLRAVPVDKQLQDAITEALDEYHHTKRKRAEDSKKG